MYEKKVKKKVQESLSAMISKESDHFRTPAGLQVSKERPSKDE